VTIVPDYTFFAVYTTADPLNRRRRAEARFLLQRTHCYFAGLCL